MHHKLKKEFDEWYDGTDREMDEDCSDYRKEADKTAHKLKKLD